MISCSGWRVSLVLLWICASPLLSQQDELESLQRRIRKGVIQARQRTVLLQIPADKPGEGVQIGTGAVVAADGLILTCAHVLNPKRPIEVVTPNGHVFQGVVLGHHPAADLALIRIPATDLTPFRVGGATARPDRWALAVGHPIGPTPDLLPSVSLGRIRAIGRDLPVHKSRLFRNMIWSDVPAGEGFSGGPLTSLDGKYLLGINAAADTDHPRTFSIPISRFLKLLPTLIRGQIYPGRLAHGSNVQPPKKDRLTFLRAPLDSLRKRATPWSVEVRSETDLICHGTVLPHEKVIATLLRSLPAPPQTVRIRSGNGQEFQTRVIYKDPHLGLAFLRIPERSWPGYGTPPPSRTPECGDLLLSLGPRNTPLSVGILSAPPRSVLAPFLRRVLPEVPSSRSSFLPTSTAPLLQHDSPLSQSDLGGPLVSSSGHLVGINLVAPLRGVSLSVPIHLVRERLNRLQIGQRLTVPKPGYLGLQLAPLPTEARQTARIPGGVLVTQVLPGFSGHRAGILRGDIILRIGTQPTSLYEQLKGWLMCHPGGTETTIHILRKQKRIHFPIVLEDPPQ